MTYDFDEIISRDGTFAEKTDRCEELFGSPDVIPMWVADMDFRVAQPIVDTIKNRAEHPIFGYTYRSESFFNAVVNWVKRRNGWDIRPDWIDCVPGVVPGFVFAFNALTEKGDGILIQTPVYHPFARQIKANDRMVVENPLKWVGGRYEIDFDDLDRKLPETKAFLMCNPHNPTGRVFTRGELERIGELCVKHDVKIISDEIHSDLVYEPHRHIHIASLGDELAQRTITFIAPSKTFNLAGLSTAVAVTANSALKRTLRIELDRIHADGGNIFGNLALEAAYNDGEEWLGQLLVYLKGNIDYMNDFIKNNLPGVFTSDTEGTYLMWVNFSAWGMDDARLLDFITREALIGVNPGVMFSARHGSGWLRFNVATPRSQVEKAMNRLLEAYRTL